MENEKIRCRKCRSVLLFKNTLRVLDAHGEDYHDAAGGSNGDSECICSSVKEHNCLYLSEDSFPDFILQAIEESSWTKGKIYCPGQGCHARLGSFNFVCGSQCECGAHVLPQVHILRSKVDWIKGSVLPHPVSFPNHSVVLSASTLPLDDPNLTSSPSSSSSSEVDVLREGVVAVDAPSSPGVPQAGHTPPEPNSSRSQRKKVGAQHRNTRVKSRRQETSRLRCDGDGMNDELRGVTTKSSCFQVLEDELTGAEDESRSEEDDTKDVPDNLLCPVCLDVLYSPLVTKPCGHIFCEPCLRRMARPNPTSTHCPLCRQIIGQCMPCPELAHDVRSAFYDLYWKRRQFELKHNSQHLPLPWTKNFRARGNVSETWVERAGGWRNIVMMMSLNILGVGIMLYLGKEAQIHSDFKTV